MNTPKSYSGIKIKLHVPIHHEMTGCEVCAQEMLKAWKRRNALFKRYNKARRTLRKLEESGDETHLKYARLNKERLELYWEEAVKLDEIANRNYLDCGDRRMMKWVESL